MKRAPKFRIRLVTALRGGKFESYTLPAVFTSEHSALEAANRIQTDYLVEALPVVVYVIDRDGIPVARGRALLSERPKPTETSERRRVL